MQASRRVRKTSPRRTSSQNRTWCLVILAAIFLSLPRSPLAAQSRTTAGREAGIDVFGGLSDTDTAFYGTDRHYGGMAGIDYTQFRYIPRLNGRLTPSLELKGTYVSGNSVSESTLQGGLKVAFNYHRLHPYGALLVGGGNISFNPPAPLEPGFVYTSDSSFLFVYSGGLTLDILPHWSLLADYSHQSWDLGFTPPVQFYPQSVAVGVVYHLRLKGFATR